MSRETVLGQALRLALSHAGRMQEPVVLPSGHKVFPDGRVAMYALDSELGLTLPECSQDLEATPAQVAAAICAGLASSSSSMAAASEVAAQYNACEQQSYQSQKHRLS
ncbi:hypothetical protein COO60DRAFT_1628108 [Scenedesmus sp. NREL 46B-D3]|nr:hypothetical protein COO60DRAFT_1628108 [Scenedesmus sp. NREL 46B-D3]